MSLIVNLKYTKRMLKNELRRIKYCFSYLLDRTTKNQPTKLEVGKKNAGSKKSFSGDFPVSVLTPNDLNCMTTFFDIDPLSPSGKYLLVTSVPIIERIPFPTDKAQICVTDVTTGETLSVYETQGWGAQLGANAQWGADDDTIFCNDVIDGKVKGVEVKISSLKHRYLDGPIFTLSNDKMYSYSGNLQRINALIPGYGVPEPLLKRFRHSANQAKDDGIWKTELTTGASELFVTVDEIVNKAREIQPLPTGTYYIFNVKVNPQHTKLLIVLFAINVKNRIGPTLQLIIFDLKTRDVQIVVDDATWSQGGHHPNWMPNGKDILMNLKLGEKRMKFVKIDSETGSKEVIGEPFVGGGHPSVDSTGRYLMTDAYISEGLADEKGKVPIRLIDLHQDKEMCVFRVFTKRLDGPCRIDPHPVWSEKANLVLWNGVVDGKRAVFKADLSSLFSQKEQ